MSIATVVNEKKPLLDERQLARSLLREYEKAHPGITIQWDKKSTAKKFSRCRILDVSIYAPKIREVLGDRCPKLTKMTDSDLVRTILPMRKDIRSLF